jgi:hypothetical protein
MICPTQLADTHPSVPLYVKYVGNLWSAKSLSRAVKGQPKADLLALDSPEGYIEYTGGVRAPHPISGKSPEPVAARCPLGFKSPRESVGAAGHHAHVRIVAWA